MTGEVRATDQRNINNLRGEALGCTQIRRVQRKPQRANAASEWMDGEIMKSGEMVDRRMRRGLMGMRLVDVRADLCMLLCLRLCVFVSVCI